MKKEELKKALSEAFTSLMLSGPKLDRRNRVNLMIYIMGLMKTYVGSFSLLQMSQQVGHQYNRLQHLTTDSKLKEQEHNVRRLIWSKAMGLVGNIVELVIDDTSVRKFTEDPIHVSRGYIGNLGKVDKMMNAVFACFWSMGHIIPFDFMHYIAAKKLPDGHKDKSFHSKPQLALELIKASIEIAKVIGVQIGCIVADSAYSASLLLNDINQLSLHYFVGIRSNRNVVNKEGKKICQVTSLVTGLTGQTITLNGMMFIVKSAVVLLNQINHPVKLFWLKNIESGKERYFITNDLETSDQKAVERYIQRCHIDSIFFKVAKNVLMLDEGKFQKLIGYTRHYYFVSIAFTLLAYISKKEGITIFRAKLILNL